MAHELQYNNYDSENNMKDKQSFIMKIFRNPIFLLTSVFEHNFDSWSHCIFWYCMKDGFSSRSEHSNEYFCMQTEFDSVENLSVNPHGTNN
jgi:hypothetical protein